MKRKRYTTDHERRSDQLRGCIAFPLVNAALWLIGLIADELLTGVRVEVFFLWAAWFVNGLILTQAFIWRPQLGLGYISSIALTMIAVMLFGGLFLVSCFAGFAVAIPLESIAGSTNGIPVAHVLGYLVGLVLFFGGLYYLCRWVRRVYRRWRSSSPRDTPEEN